MPIALPTERTKPVADLSQQTVLVYGPPKIGKSSLAARFPDALFFECEPGLNQLDVFKVTTYAWEDFLAACKLVAGGGHNFKTIIVDTIDNAFKYCTDHVCGKHSIDYEGDLPHGKGWALVKNEWHRVLTRLASLPYGLVLISHAQDKTIETRTGEYTKTQPSLPDRARNVVLGLVDMILYCDTVTRKDAAGNLIVERVIAHRLVPTVVLKTVERQAGVLKTNSTAVLTGVVAPTAVNDPAWTVVDAFQDVLPIQAYLRDLVLKTLPERLGLDPVRDIQIITTHGKRRYRYYTCTNAAKRGRVACPTRSLPAAEVERAVVDQIRCIGEDPEVLRDTLAEVRNRAGSTIGRLAGERREIERALARLHADIRRTAVENSAAVTAPRIAELNERVRDAEVRVAENSPTCRGMI